MSKRLVKIGEAAKILRTTPDTLRKWEATGEVILRSCTNKSCAED